MTELRRRMDEAMIVRGMADKTREAYLWAVTGLAKFYHRSPDQISDAEVQAYLLHLTRDRQRSWSTCNIIVHRLRFFFHETLTRDRTTFCIPSPRQPGKLPVLLSREEVQRLIAHTTNHTHRTMFSTTYAAGLRLSEVLHLRVGDIDSARMTIRVEQGKGGKDRYTVLSAGLLALRIMGLAPMAVAPEHQRRGIGSALVRAGLEQCRQLGVGAVAVLGHPAYYPRFGFVPSARFGIGSEYEVPEDVFMVLELQAGVLLSGSGTATYHAAFGGV